MATISELAVIMTQCRDTVTAYVLFIRPPGFAEEWLNTGLWRSASAIPGVMAVADDSGKEALRFGANTSGQVVLYDRGGRLLFNGGITTSRGHVGDNLGRSAIISLLRTRAADTRRTLVFGCPLFHDDSHFRIQDEHATCGRPTR